MIILLLIILHCMYLYCNNCCPLPYKVVSFDYGMGEKNPIDEMRFYTKQNPNVAVKVCKDQVSQMLPHTFGEKTVRVYCKKLDKPSLRAARRYVNARAFATCIIIYKMCYLLHRLCTDVLHNGV